MLLPLLQLMKHVLVLLRGAVVLPSYGMTECMPISSPPLTYQLDRVGTSGKGVGPQLAIVSSEGKELPPGTIGHIAVQGPPTFTRYENVPVGKPTTHVPQAGTFDSVLCSALHMVVLLDMDDHMLALIQASQSVCHTIAF